ncbi:hypothetical protein GGE16_005662 [Rhizobium leguminosarum]|uniref:Uncharacterized protein n=1 Tax=Rhizobium leguminosarum TaxID=384 RepID=A0AAE2MRB9_RHILE|nr:MULTISPECIES: hypothetical protein [Rhizobium]MBB4293569.1 hypothetical protein [Rhizobium leguminosarum]MBB4300226.1 hypothetical protein [Rhizobium leguminosarum]MBB4311497.1 hypothetical protein [Rhizobium leguminosarum]MBB4420512.1 hypothetical protein [Rhizobium leguminosarum]MBB4435851.1 hypothetical protein [Rhizobium esperanzae]
MVDKQKLNAGFTGTPAEQPEGLTKAAKSAADGVTREVYAVASGVRAHPHTASALLLGTGILAFGLGYLVGRSSTESMTGRYWR